MRSKKKDGGENLIRSPHSARLWRLGAARPRRPKRRLPMGKSRSAVSCTKFKISNSKSQLPESRPRDPSRSMRLPHVRYWVRAFVRGWVDRYVRPCVRGCTRDGARREVHKLHFERIAPIGSVGYFLFPAPCSGAVPTFLPQARVAGRGGCADVLGVSVVSEVKLPASSADRNESQTNT